MNRTTQVLALAMVAGLALVLACGGQKAEKAVKDYEELSKRACACADLPCAKAVLNDFKQLSVSYKDLIANQDQMNRVHEATKSMTICIMKKGITVTDIKEVAETVNKLTK